MARVGYGDVKQGAFLSTWDAKTGGAGFLTRWFPPWRIQAGWETRPTPSTAPGSGLPLEHAQRQLFISSRSGGDSRGCERIATRLNLDQMSHCPSRLTAL